MLREIDPFASPIAQMPLRTRNWRPEGVEPPRGQIAVLRAFSPATLTFRAGAPYRLILENAGGRTHFFVSQAFFKSIAARELRSGGEAVSAPRLEKIALEPGAAKELWFVATETGAFDLVCTAFLHETFGMTGSIQVL